jgi:hypothetical protein
MKYLFLIIFSFSAYGGYITEADFLSCQNEGVVTVYTKQEVCGQECFELPKDSYCQSLELITDEDGKKSLVENADKKAAHLAKLKQIEDAQKIEADKKALAKEKLKTFDKSKITTVAAARDWIAEIVEILK